MTATLAALAVAAGWAALLITVGWRFRQSKSLEEYSDQPPSEPPLLSVIIPARDEAIQIEDCLNSILASRYPRLEVILVDDHSTDGTGALARAIAALDPRLRVVEAPDLPAGWFGKQWACQTGALASAGSLLLFTDADTTHAPDLHVRMVNAMQARGSHLLTVAGHQVMGSFWEKVIQPFVFVILLSRYGGLETMSRSRRPLDKIANGQCILVRRDAWERTGGHAAVRSHVAEDLRLAQEWAAAGLEVHMLLGRAQLSTRMYRSLGEIRRGWGKNVYAAGRDTLPLGAVGRAILPWIFPLPALVPALPLLLLAAGALGWLGSWALVLGTITFVLNLLFWAGAYHFSGLFPLWALAHPLGAVMFSWICAESAARGSRVSWKGRSYLSQSE